jgi:hypothetical protein
MTQSFPENLRKDFAAFKKLRTPAKIQDFVNGLAFNFERPDEDTLRSPQEVLRARKAHCLEGAMFAAAALWYHGHPPLLLHLRTAKRKPAKDWDHAMALFKMRGQWGAISKTNHAVLRYREPVYRSVRELAMSYFHEYFLDTGLKTLREYSTPFDLRRFDGGGAWLTSPHDLWDVEIALDRARHYPVLTRSAIKNLRLADPVERNAGKIVEQKKRYAKSNTRRREK